MIDPFELDRDSRHIAQRRLWAALGFSVLVHLALVIKIPQVTPLRPLDEAMERGPLIVELTPPPAPPATRPREPEARLRAPAPTPAPVPQPRAAPRPPAKALERSRPAPPVIAREPPAAPVSPMPPQVPPQATTPPAPPRPSGDLSAYVEARRRARGEVAPPATAPDVVASAPVEDENARANRIAAANLGLNRTPTFGTAMRKGGGVFDIRRVVYDYAEFWFYGWNKDMERHTLQKIEVRRETEKTIQIAVVRRVIGIIRQEVQGDFTWESHRLGRTVTLSARPRDDAGLQAFLMQEFFEDPRRPAYAR